MTRYLWRESRSGLWHVDARWADRLLPQGAGEFPLIESLRGAEQIKKGRGRRIVRFSFGGTVFYAKRYEPSWRGRRQIRREWRTAIWAARRELPVARPVAACWKAGAATLVTESAGPQTLARIIHDHYYPPCDDEPPYPGDRPPELMRLYRRRVRHLPTDPATVPATVPVPRPKEIAAMLADLLLRLDRLGLRHLDLHPGNLVVTEESGESGGTGKQGRWRLVLLDLPQLHVMPGPASLHEHLVQLNHYFEPLASCTERFRLLHLLDKAGLNLRPLARRLESDTWRYHRRQWRGRDARPTRCSKYFCRIQSADFRGMAASDVAEEILKPSGTGDFGDAAGGGGAEEGGQASLAAQLEIIELLKSSRHGQAGIGRLGDRRVFIKRHRAASGGRSSIWRALKDIFRPSRQKRGWLMANALMIRGIGTARPLLWLDRRKEGESILVTEALEKPWQSLDVALPEAGGGAGGGPARRSLVEAVARTIRRLHESGLEHRDLKAQNVLVRRDGFITDSADGEKIGWKVALVDMDGVRRHRGATGRGRRIQNIMRLAFSWSGVGISGQSRGLTRSDRLRFLKCYLGGEIRRTITISARLRGGGKGGNVRCRKDGSAIAAVAIRALRGWWVSISAALDEKSRRARH